MDKQAGFGAIPNALASKILWYRDLHFLDRLRCQEVCKSWKSYSQEQACEVERTGVSHELCIKFLDWDLFTVLHQHTALQLDEDPPTIRVVPEHEDALSMSRDYFSPCC